MEMTVITPTIPDFTGDRLEIYWTAAYMVALSRDDLHRLFANIHTAIRSAIDAGLIRRADIEDRIDGSRVVILSR